MGELKNSIKNTARAVASKAVNAVGRVLPARINKLIIGIAWTLGFGKGAVVSSVTEGVDAAVGGISVGVTEAVLGASSVANGIKTVGKETFGAATGILNTALKVSNARRAASEVVNEAVVKAAV